MNEAPALRGEEGALPRKAAKCPTSLICPPESCPHLGKRLQSCSQGGA
jgi:hypothetical protein